MTILAGAVLLMFGCSENSSGPENSPPLIDSIITNPASVHPGSDVVLAAYVTDPDGDSISLKWSTYPKAGRFSDTLAALCTLTVTPVLTGGMQLQVMLEVSDGLAGNDTGIWIPLIEGETVSGHIYYQDTYIPIPSAIVSVGKLVDTSSFSGAYEIKHLSPGPFTLEVSREGCAYQSEQLTIDTGLTHDVFIECADLTSTVDGVLLAYNEVGLENVKVTILNDDGTPTLLNNTTDQSGHFEIQNVPPGSRFFAVEDMGNPNYTVLSDTFAVKIVTDTTIELHGHVKNALFLSVGITKPEEWIFGDLVFWKGWLINSDDQCYYYNSCEIDGFGLMTMANPVSIPADADNVAWSLEATLFDATLVIGYVVDGESIYTENAAVQTGNFSVTRTINIPNIDIAGHQLAIELYAWGNQNEDCASVCLTRFELSYSK
ncbi:MAG: hypothetical protein AB1746_07395 [Candidatus Zixiibacteriota bacterium]